MGMVLGMWRVTTVFGSAIFSLVMASTGATAQSSPKIEIVPQIPHAQSIGSLEFSKDGKHLLSGGYDALKVWDVATGQLIRSIQGRAFLSAFSPDGTHLISADDSPLSSDEILGRSLRKVVQLWDASSGDLVRSFASNYRVVGRPALVANGKHLVTASESNTQLWDLTSGKFISVPGSALAFSPDGTRMLWGSSHELVLSDLFGGREVRRYKGHTGPITAAAFSADGTRVLSGSKDKTLKLWDATSDQLFQSFDGHTDTVNSVAVSPDNKRVLSSSSDYTVKLWDASTGKVVHTLGGVGYALGGYGYNVAASVVFSPDGTRVASGGWEKQPHIWDADSGRVIRTFEGFGRDIYAIAFSPDGTRLLVGMRDKLGLLDATSGQLIRTYIHWGALRGVAYSPDGTRLISSGTDATLKLWDATSNQLIRTFTGHAQYIDSVAYSRDGKRLLSSSWYALKLWDVASGQVIRSIEEKGTRSVAFSPDGTLLLSNSGSLLKLWNAESGTLVQTFKGHADTIESVAFSFDGKRVLSGSGSAESTLKLWDVASGQLIRTFQGHKYAIKSVAFSPDGKRLLSGAEDKTLKLWDAASFQLIRTFEGHTASVRSVAYSPDGKRVASVSDDKTMRLWDAETGREISTFMADRYDDWVAITPAGFFTASRGESQALAIAHGLDVYSVAQVQGQLYRPDLVEDHLRGDPEGKYADAASRLNLQTVLDSGPAPQIEHLPNRTERVGNTVRVTVRLTGQGGGVGKRVIWRVNGVVQGDPTPRALVDAESSLASVVVSESLKLLPGKSNMVEVTAYNRAGLVASAPLKITIDSVGTTTEPRPHMFVLALGVDAYRMKDYKLSYAAHDAVSVAKALHVVGSSLFAEVKLTTLTDEKVNEVTIAAAIDKIAREVKPSDAFVLFLAGHGKSIAGRYYFYPQTLDFAAGHTVATHGIGQEKWEAWLAKIAVQNSLLIIDTCEGDAFRGSRGTDAARQTAMVHLQNATGRNIIAASREVAYEGYQGHGVLTYAILEALGKAKSAVGDDQIRVNAVAEYIGARVPQITQSVFGMYQLPTRRLVGSDFPIGIRKQVLTLVGELTIPKEPTHVLIRRELVREKPAADAPGSRTLAPGTQVRAVEYVRDWVIIAREGQKLGYVPADAVERLQ